MPETGRPPQEHRQGEAAAANRTPLCLIPGSITLRFHRGYPLLLRPRTPTTATSAGCAAAGVPPVNQARQTTFRAFNGCSDGPTRSPLPLESAACHGAQPMRTFSFVRAAMPAHAPFSVIAWTGDRHRRSYAELTIDGTKLVRCFPKIFWLLIGPGRSLADV